MVRSQLTEFDVTKLFSVDSEMTTPEKSLSTNCSCDVAFTTRSGERQSSRADRKLCPAPRPDDERKVTFCFSADTRESYKPLWHERRACPARIFSSTWATQLRRPQRHGATIERVLGEVPHQSR